MYCSSNGVVNWSEQHYQGKGLATVHSSHESLAKKFTFRSDPLPAHYLAWVCFPRHVPKSDDKDLTNTSRISFLFDISKLFGSSS